MTEQVKIPSWMRWPPNCCETCTGPWQKRQGDEWTGVCGKAESLEFGVVTDARFRCPSFSRKPDPPPAPGPAPEPAHGAAE